MPGTRPLVVLQVITKGEVGGAQTHVITLCGALASRVRFIAGVGGFSLHSNLSIELQKLGVPVHPIVQLTNSLSPLKVMAAVRALIGLVREYRPDVLHAHSSAAGVVARIAARITRTPVVYTVHGFGFKPQAPRLQRWVAWMAEWSLAPITTHMICVSECERQLARMLPVPPDRLSVVLNAVAECLHRGCPDNQPARIVMVARAARPKRHDLLLQALALVRDRLGREVNASLIGGGPGLEECQTLAETLGLQCVEFAGDLDDVPRRLVQHQIFVLMSDHEGMPISIIEAMRAGLAIVASDLPGIRELLTHRLHGLLVDNNAQGLAEALLSLITAPELRARLGHAARQHYEARFTPAKMADAVEELYGQISSYEPTRHHAH